MKIRIHSAELNRMLKVVMPCIDSRGLGNSNIELKVSGGAFFIRGGAAVMSAMVSTPVLDDADESVMVDGATFQKACAVLSGEAEILTEGKLLTVKGAGRTRLPIVENGTLPEMKKVDGQRMTVAAEAFSRAWSRVAYAVGNDESRPVLMGALLKSDGQKLRMVTLDGFQLSTEEIDCEGDPLEMIVPGGLMKLLATAVSGTVTVTGNDHVVQAEADGVLIRGSLLVGKYVDYEKVLPKEFAVTCRVKSDVLRNALKCGQAINGAQKLLKMDLRGNVLQVSNNSDQAAFDAELDCLHDGNDLTIAFNEKYLMNLVNAIDDDEIELCFNSAASPVVAKSMDGCGVRLVLPVRVFE